MEDNSVCVEAGAEEETGGNGVTGPEATNTAVLLLIGEITATAEDVKLVAEVDGGVINTAGGAVRAETIVAEDAVLVEDAVFEEDAVLEVNVAGTERAVLELGGSACGGSTPDVERAGAVAGPTVPTTPSIIEIVVAGLLTTIYAGVSTVIVMVVKPLLKTSKYCGIGDASAVPNKYCSKHQATYITRYMTAEPF